MVGCALMRPTPAAGLASVELCVWHVCVAFVELCVWHALVFASW
jgi:hypothetical protein